MSSDLPLTLAQVTFTYGSNTVLDRLDFSLPSRTVHVVTGHNGSGKSTLARVCANVRKPNVGNRAGDDRCSFVPSAVVAPNVTVRRWSHGFAAPEDDVERALNVMSFRGNWNGRCSSLSFGNWRKVLLACALARETRLVVLDEATAGLDRAGVEGVRELLNEASAAGKSIAVVDQFSAAELLSGFPLSTLSSGRLVRTK